MLSYKRKFHTDREKGEMEEGRETERKKERVERGSEREEEEEERSEFLSSERSHLLILKTVMFADCLFCRYLAKQFGQNLKKHRS